MYNNGIRSVAVSLLHSYTFRDHEEQIGKIAQVNFSISISENFPGNWIYPNFIIFSNSSNDSYCT